MARGNNDEIDWAEIFWRLQQYFPHDPRFNAENFAFTPIKVIFQALEYGHKFQKENLHCQELGIATLTSYFVNANKDPKKGNRVTPSDFFFFKPDNATDINPDCATTLFSLIDDKLAPAWAIAYIPIKEFVGIRHRGNITTPRALISEESKLLIISPKIYTYNIFCQFIVAFDSDCTQKPEIIVHDIDKPNMTYKISFIGEPNKTITLSNSNYTVNLSI